MKVMTLKNWLKKSHPDIYNLWVLEQALYRRQYQRNWMRKKYYNKVPTK